MSKKIGAYCREYRKQKHLVLHDFDCNVKTVSAFENGRSSNMKLLTLYVNVALIHGEVSEFMNGLAMAMLDKE